MSVGPLSERKLIKSRFSSLWRRVQAWNIRLCFPYRQNTKLFIFRLVLKHEFCISECIYKHYSRVVSINPVSCNYIKQSNWVVIRLLQIVLRKCWNCALKMLKSCTKIARKLKRLLLKCRKSCSQPNIQLSHLSVQGKV